MFKQILVAILSFTFLFFCLYASASERCLETTLLNPRCVKLRLNLVESCVNRSMKYQTSYTYNYVRCPVQIIEEFNNWRQIKDISSIKGWIHQSLPSSSRYVLISNNKIFIAKHLVAKLPHNQSLIFKAANKTVFAILEVEYGILT